MSVPPTRRLRLSIALLVAVQLATSLGAVVLFGRMSPAIERILFENVASSETVEEMALALLRVPRDPGAARRYEEALARAKGNITLAEEEPAIHTLERVQAKALAGDAAAMREATGALEHLGEVNRIAMRQADIEAQRLGTAGGWAAVFLALAGLSLSGVTLRRLERRLLQPLGEIIRATAAHRAGDNHRRCTVTPAGRDLEPVMLTLNELFDRRERAAQADRPSSTGVDDRAMLLELLDQRSEPTAIVDGSGAVLAANRSALLLVARASGPELRDALAQVAAGHASPRVHQALPLGDGGRRLCVLAPARNDQA